MRRSIRSTIGALVAVSTVAVGSPAVAAPATAASTEGIWVRPNRAPLLDPDGARSGCQGRIKGGAFPNPAGVTLLRVKAEMRCDTFYPRQKYSTAYQVVLPDGTRSRVYGEGGGMSISFVPGEPPPGWEEVGATGTPICLDPDRTGLIVEGGSYQLVIRLRLTVKSTIDSSGVPWSALVEKLVDVDC